MNARKRVVHLAGVPLEQQHHVCAFFHTRDEQYRVLLPFIQEGLAQGERVFKVIDPGLRADHLRRLQAAGIDVVAAERSGQLEIRGWGETYLRKGRFDWRAWQAALEEVVTRGVRQAAPPIRVVVDMGWALQEVPGVDELVEWEAQANVLLAELAEPTICTYDLTRFGAGVIVDVLRTHPVAIIGGVPRTNPFFVPPEEFLRELRERG